MTDSDFFRQATLAVCGHLEIGNALHACLRVIRQRIPAERAYLELFDFGTGAMRTVARATPERGERLNQIIPLPEQAVADAETVNSTDVVVINDPTAHPIARAMNEAFGEEGSSCLAMPLAIEAEPVGLLVLTRRSGEPFSPEHAQFLGQLNEPVAIALAHWRRHEELLSLKERLTSDNRFLQDELSSLVGDRVVGARSGLKEVMERVGQVASLDSPVLLLGETGVGKEVVANAIHAASPRREGPFIKVNAGAIPDTLLDTELFGHEKGAFTGALSQKRGRFERAHGGTLFLDEIGELLPAAQVRLLRVLQHREIERVGGAGPVPVDVRVISATHRDLGAMVAKGQFREDLWFRLNVFPVVIPPLRERPADLRALVAYLVAKKCVELKLGPPPSLAAGALDVLVRYPWPGNVRELANVIERALILGRGRPLTFDSLVSVPTPVAAQEPVRSRGGDAVETLDEATARHIRRVLDEARGRIHGPGGAAERLGIKPTTLRYRMDKLGIPYRKQGRTRKE